MAGASTNTNINHVLKRQYQLAIYGSPALTNIVYQKGGFERELLCDSSCVSVGKRIMPAHLGVGKAINRLTVQTSHR